MWVGRLLVLQSPILQLFKGHRPADSVALPVAAAKFLHDTQLRIGFNSLSYGVKSKALGQ
jgi:hypothetical protein